jgi:hypothetical protein
MKNQCDNPQSVKVLDVVGRQLQRYGDRPCKKEHQPTRNQVATEVLEKFKVQVFRHNRPGERNVAQPNVLESVDTLLLPRGGFKPTQAPIRRRRHPGDSMKQNAEFVP